SAAGWLGCLCHMGHKIQVADTAAHLLPGTRNTDTSTTRQVLWLTDTALGLVCDTVIEQERHVDPQQVCWRGPGTSRPWLAGTLSQPRCALIERRGLLAVLEQSRPASFGD